MTGDFSSRFISEDPNFHGVLHQQGRVLLDRDWNAQTEMNGEWQDAAGSDIIGGDVAAVPADNPTAFKVETAQVVGADVQITLDPGRIWVGGWSVSLAGAAPATRTATYLQPPIQSPAASTATIGDGVRDAVVLEVWREAVSGFQLPDLLIEPALGGPDTTERLYTASALRLLRLGAGDTCESILGTLGDQFGTKGKLNVSLKPTTHIGGDCDVVDAGGYTGFEHSLYRIEIAAVTSGDAMFKWSRFNGGLVGRGVFDAVNKKVTLTANVQAIVSSGLDSFYLETREFDVNLGRWTVTYGAAVTLNNQNELVLPAAATYGAIPGMANPVFFRLWDGLREVGDFLANPPTVPLVDGIFLFFDAPAPGSYTPEDFWTFKVRAGGIANPLTLIGGEPPEGVRHQRVSLGVLDWNAAKSVSAAGGGIEDCRRIFQPLTRLGGCCTYRVGDGMQSHGEFTSIQAAIDHLPAAGGEICILPGLYTENITIQDKANIVLSGCGDRSQIVSAGGGAPVIHVHNSQGVTIEHLAVSADPAGPGILLDGPPIVFGGEGPLLQHITLDDLWIKASVRSAVEGHVGEFLTVTRCRIEMGDVFSPWPGIFIAGSDVLIEDNTVTVPITLPIETADGAAPMSGAGRGGIQIGGTSERVRIAGNRIEGGIGNGITLGSLMTDTGNDWTLGWVVDANDPCAPCAPGNVQIGGSGGGGTKLVSAGALYEITIEDNRILDMGLNGIGVVGFFTLALADEFISVDGLSIIRNEIRRCLTRSLADIPAEMLGAMGYGGVALADVETLIVQDNWIEGNGPDYLQPVCGIYVLHGVGVEISRNRILNNGARTEATPDRAKDGARGGVYIAFAVAPTEPTPIFGTTFPGVRGVPAVTMAHNVVAAPLGQALALVALGPVSVTGNTLTTQGVVTKQGPPSPTLVAATVSIMNLGLSDELYLQLALFSGIKNGSWSMASPDASDTVPLPRPGLDDERIGQYLANGNVLFSGNQVALNLVGTPLSVELSSIIIFSLDDIAMQDNQCDCDMLLNFAMTHAFTFGWSVRVTGNRFTEGLLNAYLSAATFGLMNMTVNNQTTHCMLILGWPSMVVSHPNSILVEAGAPGFCGKRSGLVGGFGQ